jgi:hypothetical protein
MTRHRCYQEAKCLKHKKEVHLDLKNLYTVSHHRHPQLNLHWLFAVEIGIQFLKHAGTYKEECVNQLGSMHESENYFPSVLY